MDDVKIQKDENHKQRQPVNFSPSPDFKWLCEELFVKLDSIQTKPKEAFKFKSRVSYYYEIIQSFINLWRMTVGNDIFPAIILILPYRDRRNYNIRDVTLIKLVCEYLKLPKNSSTEKKLMNWKKLARKSAKLSDYCIEEIRKRKSEPLGKRNIKIDELNQFLDNLATKSESYDDKKQNRKTAFNVFEEFFNVMSFVELKFLFDIILKQKVIGGLEHKFLKCWHPDAQDYLSVVSDLRLVTQKLWNSNYRLKEEDISINVNHTFSPQAAKRVTIPFDSICSKLNHRFFIEEKMDGERIQLHFMNYGSDIKYFSRRGIDYTHLYGKNLNSGSISCYFKLHPNVKECIFDGEMVTYDLRRQLILPFGMVKSVAHHNSTGKEVQNIDYHPLFMVFDLVFLNGSSLASLPLHKRKEYLDTLITSCPTRVQILPSIKASESQSIKTALEKAIFVSSEGLILKRYDSIYSVADRNDDWIKVKPEYLEQFGENLDLIIIGRDKGKRDSYMCGLAVYEGEENASEILLHDEFEKSSENLIEDPDHKYKAKKIIKFISFCNIANGISQSEFEEIDRKTRGFWHKFDFDNPPSDTLDFGTKKPQEWIDPKNSVVLEIKARSLENVSSSSGSKYKSNCTLYGGYCRGIRDDKDWTTCCSFTELSLARNSRSFKRKTLNQNFQNVKKLKIKKKISSLNNVFKCETNQSSESIFEGLHFYVLSDYFEKSNNERLDVNSLTKLILLNGGTIVHNLIAKDSNMKNLRILSFFKTVECIALIERGYDIISPQWIKECLENKFLVKLEPSHCFNVSQNLMDAAEKRVDIFGDSYQLKLSDQQLKNILSQKYDDLTLNKKEISSMDCSKEVKVIPMMLLASRRFLILEEKMQAQEVEHLRYKIKLYGGSIVKELNSCNIVVASDLEESNVNFSLTELRKETAKMATSSSVLIPIPRIVSPQWVDDSIASGHQVIEEDYQII